MNKTLLSTTATALLLISTSVKADGPNIKFYGGAQAGGTFSKTNFKIDSHLNAGGLPVALIDQKLKQDTGDKFFIGGIFSGVRLLFGNFFTGFEAEANWDGMNIKTKAPIQGTGEAWRLELKRRYQLIPSIVMGWKMNEQTALYGKLGAGISKFTLAVDRGARNENVRSRTVVHFVPAIGAEYELNQNSALRLEVSGEIAGRPIKGDSEGPVNPIAVNQVSKARYSAISVKVGALFKI